MAKQTILEESTRVYDEAFSAWLGNCLVDYDSLGGSPKTDFPILRVYAAPDRSFAPVADMLVAREFVSDTDAAAMRARAETDRDMRIFPLPLLTLTRGDPVIEPRGSQAKIIERAAFDPLKGVWQRHRMPTFYRTPYTASLWCLYRYTEAYIREWFMAQVGQPGAGADELFLQIQHAPPWNTQLHSLRLESVNDNSELEGAGPRAIRVDFQFNMRQAWLHPMVDEVPPVDFTAHRVYTYADGGEIERPATETVTATLGTNLFRPPWEFDDACGGSAQTVDERTVGGEVFQGVRVRNPADTVAIAGYPLRTDQEGLALVSLSLQYRASVPAVLLAQQADLYLDTALTVADRYDLPASGRMWRQLHRFAFLDQRGFQATITGAGSPDAGTVYLRGVAIRALRPPYGGIAPGAPVPVAGGVEYRWPSLPREPFLVGLSIATTGGVTLTLAWRNSIAGATVTESRPVNDTAQRSTVFVGIPLNGTMALFVPTGASLARVLAVPYAGPYDGNR